MIRKERKDRLEQQGEVIKGLQNEMKRDLEDLRNKIFKIFKTKLNMNEMPNGKCR